MESFKRLLLPSSLFFTSAVSSILLSYYLRFSLKSDLIISLVFTAISIALYAALIISWEFSLSKAALLAAIAIAIIAFSSLNTLSITKNYKPADEWRVSEIKEKRYLREINLSSDAGNAILFTKSGKIMEDDVIKLKSKFRKAGTSNSYERHLLREGISFTSFASDSEITTVSKGELSLRKKVRSWIENRADSTFDRETASLVKAIYFGSSEFITKRDLKEYKDAGLLHLIAASGFNIGIVVFIPMLLLSFFTKKKSAFVILSLMVLSYYLITDTPISLLRAAAMFWLAALAVLFDLERDIVNIILLAATLIVIIYPYELYSISFQLSAGATLAIVLFHKEYLKTLPKLPLKISESVALTLSSSVTALPILCISFGEINITGILSNIVAVPAVTVGTYSSIAAIAASSVSHIGSVLSWMTEKIFTYNFYAVKIFSDLNLRATYSHLFLIPYTALLIPVFTGDRRMAGIISIWLSVVIAAAMMLWNIQNEEIIISKSGSLAIISSKEKTVLIGKIDDEKEFELAEIQIKMHSAPPIMIITGFGKNGFSVTLLKRHTFESCYIESSALFTKESRRAMQIFDRDEAKIKAYRRDSPDAAIAEYCAIFDFFQKISCNNGIKNDIILPEPFRRYKLKIAD